MRKFESNPVFSRRDFKRLGLFGPHFSNGESINGDDLVPIPVEPARVWSEDLDYSAATHVRSLIRHVFGF